MAQSCETYRLEEFEVQTLPPFFVLIRVLTIIHVSFGCPSFDARTILDLILGLNVQLELKVSVRLLCVKQ